ncbi:MAG: NTP transferase domain-containing protein [Pirellulales bacterium]
MAATNATVAVLDLAKSPTQRSGSGCIFRKLNGLTLLEWSIRRLNECTLIDSIAITGTPSQKDSVLSGSLCGARWIPSIHTTPLKRVHEVAKRCQAEWVVLIAPTCPFADPVLLDRLIASAWSHPEADYIGYMATKNPKLSLRRLGLVAELCHVRALDSLMNGPLQNDSRPVADLITATDLFQMRFIPLPEPLQRDDLRFNIESIEDWDHACSYLEAVGDDLSWQRLSSLVSPYVWP